MKYAVITDIHANVYALEAALKEIDEEKPDKILCLGDMVGNGAFPEETVSLIRRRGDILCVKGNHEMFMELDLDGIKNGDKRLEMFRRQQRILSETSKKFLAGLPEELIFSDGVKKVVCFHYPKNRNGRFKDLIYLPTEEQTEELFSGLDGDVFLFGHEHTGSLQEIKGKYYLNFGTCGHFFKENCARYGIVEIFSDGKVSFRAGEAFYDDSFSRRKQEE